MGERRAAGMPEKVAREVRRPRALGHFRFLHHHLWEDPMGGFAAPTGGSANHMGLVRLGGQFY